MPAKPKTKVPKKKKPVRKGIQILNPNTRKQLEQIDPQASRKRKRKTMRA